MFAALLPMVTTPSSPLEIMLDRTAGLRITDEGEVVATIGFGLFRSGWQYTGAQSTEGGAGNPTTAKMVWSGGEATIVGEATELTDGLRFRVTATPNANVGTESTHLFANLPTPRWAGSIATIDGTDVAIPASFAGNTGLWSGNARTVRFRQGGLEVTIEGEATRASLLQDSRQWGQNVEWRYGTVGGTWNANVARTYTVTIRTPRGYRFSTQSPYTITAGPDWVELPFPLDVAAGSALDGIDPNFRPAGSRGWLQARDGHFFYPGDTQPTRFYGANLCFSACFLPKRDAERLATRMARLGYNAVRLHHFDADLTGWSGGASSTALLPDKLDQLDYLVAMMRKRGISVSLDLFTIRQIRNGEVLAGATGMDEFKALQLVNATARTNWRTFSANLMNHVNPYTGLAWKDDPAIAWVCPVNENTMGSTTRSISGTTRDQLNAAWQATGQSGAWTFETDAGARFGAQLHAETFAWMKQELRGMGVKALLTDLNGWWDQRALITPREALDYVDNHNYWDHPTFLGGDWGLPSRGWDNGGIATKARGGTGFQRLLLSRLVDKPFTVTEFNYTAPNRYRAEGGLLFGAIAARQDWDAAFRFAWSHSAESVQQARPIAYFDVQSDPATMATERAIVALFRRRGLPPATDTGVLRVDPTTAAASPYDAPMRNQVVERRLYCSRTSGGDGNLPMPASDQPVRIDDASGTITVNAVGTAGVFGPTGVRHSAGPLATTLAGHRAALWVTALDGRPIVTSQRLLLTHVTDVQNSGIRFSGPDRDVVEAWGTTPHLLRVGSAQVTLTVENPARLRVYRLDMAGNRQGEVPATRTATTLSFTVQNFGPGPATLYHELAVEFRPPVRFGPGRG
ncbi:MAG: hypothetical protein SFX74_00625 [Fimbriimonadaceae bacterium]|nr:hypothetical protein [Fimbriimonadaceae bacterium]